MTEKKRPPKEQIATHIYRQPGSSSTHHSAVSRPRIPEDMRTEAGNVSPPQRMVTKPDTVQPSAGDRYVHRRNQMYSDRAKQQKTYTDTGIKPRTFAQTGVRASSGQLRAFKRLPQYHARPATPVPVRSGRRNRQRGGLLWKVLGIFALLAIVTLGANFALTGTAFRITQVSVIGTHNAMLAQSIQHMGMQGQNIFLIDVAALTARIDLLPMVASADLEKQWPNQLLVTVTERTPVLLWQAKHGTYSVDKNGVVIAPASETTSVDTLRTVVDMRNAGPGSKGKIQPGSHLYAPDIAFAMALFERLPTVGITDFTLRYVTLPAPRASGQSSLGEYESYVVESTTGWLAYLGGPNNANPLDNRVIELQQILAMAQQEQLNLATIDLRFGLRPIYTLKS